MALKIRLSRGGAKKKPFYRIVVAEATSPRDGKFVEKIGSYNPMVDHDNKERLVIDAERVKYWISKKHFDKSIKNTLLKIGSPPEEIAKTVKFLLESKSITGQFIAVDGGEHLS